MNDDPARIKQLIDIGAQTLILPMVDRADQARNIARAMRYPPNGIRGMGTMIARASRWGQVQGYDHDAESGLCLLVQVEMLRDWKTWMNLPRWKLQMGFSLGPQIYRLP